MTDWAAGFLDAVMLRPKAWEPLVRHSEAGVLMLLVLGADDPERLPFGVRPPAKDAIEKLHADGANIIPDCVIGIRAFWRAGRTRPGAGGSGRRPVGNARRSRKA